jgi:hypothetical protein
MDTGLLLGLLLAFVNGMICLALPLILASTQRQSRQATHLTALSPSFKSSELISQEAN